MPKITNYPRLRTLVRKGANGQRWVYYYYDMRPEGKPDVALGKDHAIALVKWDELHNKKPRIKGTIEEAFALFEFEKLGVGEHRTVGRSLRLRDGSSIPIEGLLKIRMELSHLLFDLHWLLAFSSAGRFAEFDAAVSQPPQEL